MTYEDWEKEQDPDKLVKMDRQMQVEQLEWDLEPLIPVVTFKGREWLAAKLVDMGWRRD